MDVELKNQLIRAFIFLAISAGVCAIAWYKRFFTLPKRASVPVLWYQLLIAISMYLGAIFFLSPTYILFLKRFFTNKVGLTCFAHLFTTGSLSLILIYYTISQKLFTIKTNLWKNILIGASSWIIIFPLTLFISQLLDIFNLVIFNITEVPDQIAIRFLKQTLDHPTYFFAATVSIVIFAPIIEELLFRGFLQNYLKRKAGYRAAILLAALAFALIHL